MALLSLGAPVTASEWQFLSAADAGSGEGSDLARVRKQGHVAGVMLDLETDRWVMIASILAFEGDAPVEMRVLRKGETLSRAIPQNQRSKNSSSLSGQETLIFWLSEPELEWLMSGSELRLKVGDRFYAFPLTGSRTALSRLIDTLTPMREAMADDRQHSMGQAMSDCDQQAAHPWDDRRMVEHGIEWGDMYGEVAVASCREAVAHAQGTERVQMLYQLGRALDKTKDPEALRVLFEAGENYGHPMALNHLALLYWDGDYTDKDLVLAERFFRMSHDRGNVVGSYNLARFYLKEHGDEASRRDEAYDLLGAAATDGYPQAQERLGKEIMAGKIAGRPDFEALYFLEEASEAGRGGASMALAEIYRDGTLVGADPKQYLKYLKRAASQGNAAAKKALGVE
ncbi:tetratricopeptide repeat protein [Shimia sp. Alg240-R146]|uniref:tetratricopeptide repeat protein n=1 Tax=Shimia sp. Alg240-R146 TaxID=2993449 RepID=UPI0022DEC41B|nr:tetratricopeptide repeat protein [Shimia sp. Alg240-R146]